MRRVMLEANMAMNSSRQLSPHRDFCCDIRFTWCGVELSDTKVSEPQIRARLGTAAHFCEVVVLKLRTRHLPHTTHRDFCCDIRFTWRGLCGWKADVMLPGKGNSNSHDARPVHLIITMIKWIRTSRLSIKNSLSLCRPIATSAATSGSPAAVPRRARI